MILSLKFNLGVLEFYEYVDQSSFELSSYIGIMYIIKGIFNCFVSLLGYVFYYEMLREIRISKVRVWFQCLVVFI